MALPQVREQCQQRASGRPQSFSKSTVKDCYETQETCYTSRVDQEVGYLGFSGAGDLCNL